jgi:uncharacterized membrane protein
MTRTGRPPRRSTLVLTAVLHVLVLWPYSASGLVAPGWAVLALLGLWAGLGWAAYVVHRRWGAVAALVPLLAMVLWTGVLVLGEQVLGWTA